MNETLVPHRQKIPRCRQRALLYRARSAQAYRRLLRSARAVAPRLAKENELLLDSLSHLGSTILVRDALAHLQRPYTYLDMVLICVLGHALVDICSNMRLDVPCLARLRRPSGEGRTHARTHAHTQVTEAHVHARTHARTHAGTHTGTHAGTHASTHACMHARTHASTHVRTHTRTHARTRARTHTHTHPVAPSQHAPR